MSAVAAAVVALSVAGCRGVPSPSGEPDRAETIPVAGGECELSWWLTPLSDDVPDDAWQIAEQRLADAEVSQSHWDEWRTILDSDPDIDWTSEGRLQGRAYLEAVRADVRAALEAAGYPDTRRVIEVYSDIACSE
ncbi:hypothetical protein J2Y69_002017 [Microbacterium resistens]|uniref:Lipoprotein n=1 Tax=Microbacterium resistens TaxID=156977 RepID=A0ABU1SCT4_9MICO|nr:hypothetical protein [Microbacterium resistens]MDR6867414.1 hypothetical protein [Microbacterium resistens]